MARAMVLGMAPKRSRPDPSDVQEAMAQAILTIVLLINSSWGVKRDVLAEVGRRQLLADGGPVAVSYRSIAGALNTNPRYTQRVMGALVVDRVLDVVEAGAGRRPATYRINPNVDKWRNVPLRGDAEQLMWRLDALGFGRSAYLQRILGAVPARPMSIGGSHLLHLFSTAPSASQPPSSDGSLSASQVLAALDQFRDFLDSCGATFAAQADLDRATTGELVPRLNAALPSVERGAAPFSSGSLRSPLENGGGGAPPAELDGILRAIHARTGQHVGPPLRRRLAALVTSGAATVEQLERWLAQTPPSFGPPLIVDQLVQMACAGDGAADVTPRRSRELLEQLRAVYVVEAPELVEDLDAELDELAEWEASSG
jgi:hypothetical protein